MGVGFITYAKMTPEFQAMSRPERALLFVTDRFNVIYVPTTEGYSVLLSTVHPEEFIDALEEEMGGS